MLNSLIHLQYQLLHGAGSLPRDKRPDPSNLGLEVWGRKFSNPVGLAAGFDKNADAVEGLLGMGFGFAELTLAQQELTFSSIFSFLWVNQGSSCP